MMTHTLRRFQQRGATLIVVALGVGMALAAMMALDIGNLVWQKRELQKIADLAALAGVAEGGGQCVAQARANAEANGLLDSDTFKGVAGTWETGDSKVTVGSAPGGNACQVEVSRTVPYLFMFDSDDESRTLRAHAIAAISEPLAMVHVRSKLLGINSELSNENANLLNLVFGGLLGGKLRLDLLSWQGIADANISIYEFLSVLDAKLRLGGVDNLLKADISLGDLLQVMGSVVGDQAASVGLGLLRQDLAKLNVSNLKIKLNEFLQLEAGSVDAGLNTSVNAFELLQVFLQAANKRHAIQAKIGIPPLVSLNLSVTELPQWKIGNPSNQEVSAKTAQVKLSSDVNLLLIDVGLNIRVAASKVWVTDFSCALGEKSLSLNAERGLVEIETVLGILGNDIYLKLPLGKDFQQFYLNNPKRTDELLMDEDWESFRQLEISRSLRLTLSDAISNLEKSNGGFVANIVSGLALLLLQPIGGLLDFLIDKILAPILDPILNGVLRALGINVAGAEIAGQLNCGQAKLVY